MMYKSLSIPYVGWASIQTHYRQDRGPRWRHLRGRLTEHVWQMPLWRWDVTVHGRGKSYRELTGLPKYSIDWILDEFDSSFNDLAIASMKYHMDYSVCECPDERRAKYEDLIARLSERCPRFTDEELAILQPPGWKLEDEFEELPNGNFLWRESTAEAKAIYAAHDAREEAWHERMRQARHDFIDILPHLWS